jgi:hypothetical protein
MSSGRSTVTFLTSTTERRQRGNGTAVDGAAAACQSNSKSASTVTNPGVASGDIGPGSWSSATTCAMSASRSSRSPNIVRALTWACNNGLRTISVTGFGGGAARSAAEVSVHVDCINYGIVEDLHQAIMHALAQYIRQSRMAADSISASVL